MSDRPGSRPPELDVAALAAPLFFVSGVAGLLLQTAAVRAFLELYGSTAASLGAVAAAFLGCLTLGALVVGPLADRARRPLKVYALLEVVAAVGALATGWLLPRLDGLATWLATQELAGAQQTGVRFAASVALLLIPAGALGGTLPLLARLRAATRSRAVAAGMLQAASTAGALIGALGGSVFLLGALGTRGTLQAAAGLSALVALAAALLASRAAPSAPTPATAATSAALPSAALDGARPPPRAVPLYVSAFLLGAQVLALEVLLFRGMAQVVPASQDSLGVLLAAFLGASAVGSAVGVRFARSRRGAATGLLAGHLAAIAAPLLALLLLRTVAHGVPLPFLDFGESALTWPGRLLRAFVGALLVAGPAALAAAVSFPCACELAPVAAARFGRFVGGMSALWTGGAALAGLLVPSQLLPRTGLKGGLLIAAALPLLSLLLLAAAGRLALFDGRRFGGWIAAVVLSFAFLLVPVGGTTGFDDRLEFFRTTGGPGARLLDYREDALANVAVVVRRDGKKVLAVNDRLALGGSGDGRVELVQAALPAILHPGPKRVLLLGVGAGITAASVRDVVTDPELMLDGVELLPEVLNVLDKFAPENGDLVRDPRFRAFATDARAFVRAAPPATYDLVLGDLFFPWEAEAGLLYTREHFERVRKILKPGGIFCQWLPLHQLRWEEFGIVGRTFCQVFDGTTVWLARPEFPYPVVALLASKERLEIDVPALALELEQHPRRPLLEALGIARAEDLLALYLGEESLFDHPSHFARRDTNVADRARVEFLNARRIESDAVVALFNRRRLFEVHEDVSGRMSRSTLDPRERSRLQRDLAAAAQETWKLFEVQTNLLLAEANRMLPSGQRANDPDELVAKAFQIAGGVLASRPDHALAFEKVAAILEEELARRHYAQVVQGVLTLEQNPGLENRARLKNLRGRAFLLAVCEPDPEPAAQFTRPLEFAIRDLRKTVELDPKLVEAQVSLGVALFLDGSPTALEEARALLSAAREKIVAPGRPDGRGLPAAAEAIWHALYGRKSESRLWIDQASPDEIWVRKVRERLQKA